VISGHNKHVRWEALRKMKNRHCIGINNLCEFSAFRSEREKIWRIDQIWAVNQGGKCRENCISLLVAYAAGQNE